jgi:ATP diphosphatase
MPVERLLDIMARLRDPHGGCPWDREQTFATIAPYTIEEAYEVAEAIATGDMDELRLELGDLLFQVVFYSQMATEQGLFDFAGVVEAVCDKMVRRHPHVFADAEIGSAGEQRHAWERLKRDERDDKALHGALDGVAHALPALLRAQKLQKRAARVGFDWQNREQVEAEILEELAELRQVIKAPDADTAAIRAELGDLLFSCVNLARHLGVDAETALRQSNHRFERRFRDMEASLDAGVSLQQLDSAQQETLWSRAKAAEQGAEGTSELPHGSDPA